MSIKTKMLYIWENFVCEGVNRKAQKRIIYASEMWHTNIRPKQFIAMMIHASNIKKYGCEIYPQAVLGEGLYIPHCVGIVVGSTSIIGKNCTIYPNVVFGAKDKNVSGRRHAKVGDNCSFGANSTIIGAINIGNNVTVGAGAVVTKDVPDNSIVVGINKIIRKEGSDGKETI